MKTQFDKAINDIAAWQNLQTAWKQVRSNKGAAGIDGMKVEDLPYCPGEFWSKLGEELKNRTYELKPAKSVDIPKPDGTNRGLNIPCVTDRVVQASIANYITFMTDEDMSNSAMVRLSNKEIMKI